MSNFTGSGAYWGSESADRRDMFERDGSALRRTSRTNPRNLPCPTCGAANRLTPADQALGYQCDVCADQAEGIGRY